MSNFVTRAIDAGGDITPLVVPSEHTNGTGTFNPSIYNDNGKLLVNIRHCQVTLFHAEKNIFEHQWGPLAYLNPENDITLTTTNFFCEIGEDMMISKYSKVDFSKFDVKPIWEFIGLEDCRVVRWDNKLFICGVRRDTTTNGQGRMELSEVEIDENGIREISRFRLPTPGSGEDVNAGSYCEKNWMPVLDMPYHFIKWCNPTELIRVDPETKTTVTVKCDAAYIPKEYDYRGGSQVVKIGDKYVCISHTVKLFNSDQGRKNATYRHAFLVWDENWNLLKYGDQFDFLGAEIEFCAGMCIYGDDVLITFGVTDNAAYLLRVPMKFIIEECINV